MKKLSDEQKDALRRAAHDAEKYQRSKMLKDLDGTREFLINKGGMKITYPDKAEFIKAGIKVQNEFLKEKNDEGISDLVNKIREAAK